MLTVNGDDVFGGRLFFPRSGAWHAEVRVNTADEVVGSVVMDLDAGRLTMKGTVRRGGNWQDTGHLRIVGGAGGLARLATPKHYTSASVRTVLADLLANAGERLSSTADTATLGRSLESWTTAALPVGRLITRLLLSADPAATWRVLADGTVWVGVETWPDSGLDEDEFQVLAESPASAQATLGIEVPLLMPGTKLGDRKVSYVEHQIGAETRTECWFDDGTPQDRLRNALAGVVKAAQSPIDYLALYVAEVVSQTGGTVDVRPIDKRIPSMASVPLFAGVPQWKLQLAPGGRVLIGWSGGDPARRFAVAFDADVAAQSVGIEADQVTLGHADEAEASMLGETYRSAESSMNSSLASTCDAAAALCTGTLAPLAATFTALAAALNAFEATADTYLSTSVSHS